VTVTDVIAIAAVVLLTPFVAIWMLAALFGGRP
jgi:hypothetical protein